MNLIVRPAKVDLEYDCANIYLFSCVKSGQVNSLLYYTIYEGYNIYIYIKYEARSVYIQFKKLGDKPLSLKKCFVFIGITGTTLLHKNIARTL